MNENKYPKNSIIMSDTPMLLMDKDEVPAYFPLVIKDYNDDAYLCSHTSAKKFKVSISYDKIEKFNFKSLDEYKTIIQKQAKEIGNCKIIKFITIVLTIIYSASTTQIPHIQIFPYSNVIAYLLSGFMLLLLFYFNFKTNKKAKENRENIELFCLVQMVNKTLDEKECFEIFKMMKAKKEWIGFKEDVTD